TLPGRADDPIDWGRAPGERFIPLDGVGMDIAIRAADQDAIAFAQIPKTPEDGAVSPPVDMATHHAIARLARPRAHAVPADDVGRWWGLHLSARLDTEVHHRRVDTRRRDLQRFGWRDRLGLDRRDATSCSRRLRKRRC